MNNNIIDLSVNSCFICLDDNVDTRLLCCKKTIHYSCLQEWWNSNINETNICPHCRQESNCIQITNENNRTIRNVSNIRFDIDNEELQEINSNPNNIVPQNPFSHDNNPNSSNRNFYSCLLFTFVSGAFIALIIIII